MDFNTDFASIYKEGSIYYKLENGKIFVSDESMDLMDIKDFLFGSSPDYLLRMDADNELKVVMYKKPKQESSDNFTKILEWQIAQQNAMEDRLDKRLKEYIKSFGSETKELAQSHASNQLDLSALLPILQPILQKLTEGK